MAGDLPADDDLARKLIFAHHAASRHAHGRSASQFTVLPNSSITYRVDLDPQGGLELPMAGYGRELALSRFAPTDGSASEAVAHDVTPCGRSGWTP